MKHNSWIIRNYSKGYRCSQTCSTSVPFWASTGSEGHWILSNPGMEKGIPSYGWLELLSPAALIQGEAQQCVMLVWMVPALSFQAASSIAELSNPVVLQQQVLLSLARVPLWGPHRHCLPLSNLHLSQFLQAAELAVVPCNKKMICTSWTGIYML